MPTPVVILLVLGFIFFMGFLVDIFASLNPAIMVPSLIIIFLVGWFVVWGIASKDNNQTIKEGAKEGIEGLFEWAKYILIMIAIAIFILIFAGLTKF